MTAERINWLNHPTRRRMLEAAEEQFAETGYAGARVDRIAAAAQVSKSHLYFHFPSKADLLVALVDLRTAEILAGKDAVLGAGVDVSDSAGIAAVLERLFTDGLRPFARFARVVLIELLSGSAAVAPVLAALDAALSDTMRRLGAEHPPDDRLRALWLHFAIIPALFAVAVPRPLVAGIDPATLAPELADLDAALLRRLSSGGPHA